jgi:hypothetical protein
MNITFECRHNERKDWDDEENIDIVYISQGPYEKEFIKNPDEIVIPLKEIKIKYTYPLSNPVVFTYQSEDGFTRLMLINNICETYKNIYKLEEEISDAPGRAWEGSLNRGTSDGPYGIWGHDIDDLSLDAMYQLNNGMFELSISS